MKRNSGAEMTALNLWHFFGWGVGHVPKRPEVLSVRAPRNATQELSLPRKFPIGWTKKKPGQKEGRVATMKLTKQPPLGPVFDLLCCYTRVQ